MMTIPLRGALAAGRVVLVDDADFETLTVHIWHAYEKDRGAGRKAGPYAQANVWTAGKRRQVFMHTMITGWRRTDHVNHDGLDNQRRNLRPASNAENIRNSRPFVVAASRFKGVSCARNGTWMVRIQVSGRRRYLGTFASEVTAALAYDRAARQEFGEYAYLNFPEGA